ncbi:MAG: T9SS type A sorting domain-containing protein, partial [Ignavibacteria bacterium]
NPDQIKVRLLAKGDGTITADAIRIIYSETVTDVEKEYSVIDDFQLLQNFPNPFNNTTIIRFNVLTNSQNPQTRERVILKIYDILGKEIATLKDEFLSSGEFEVEFDPSRFENSLSSGVYFVKLNLKGKSKTIKMVYLK